MVIGGQVNFFPFSLPLEVRMDLKEIMRNDIVLVGFENLMRLCLVYFYKIVFYCPEIVKTNSVVWIKKIYDIFSLVFG